MSNRGLKYALNRFGVMCNRLVVQPETTAPVWPSLHITPTATPTGTGAEGDMSWNDTANAPEWYDGTQWRKAADRYVIKHSFNASSVDDIIFTADRAYKVLSVTEIHTVAGNDAGAVTLMIEKCTGTTAPGSGTDILTGTFNLKGTANTLLTGTLSATASDYTLAAGNRLVCDYTGTLTTLAGGCVTIVLEAV